MGPDEPISRIRRIIAWLRSDRARSAMAWLGAATAFGSIGLVHLVDLIPKLQAFLPLPPKWGVTLGLVVAFFTRASVVLGSLSRLAQLVAGGARGRQIPPGGPPPDFTG